MRSTSTDHCLELTVVTVRRSLRIEIRETWDGIKVQETGHGWLCKCDAVAWLVMVVST